MSETGEQSLISHPSESIEQHTVRLRRAVEEQLPELRRQAQLMPQGFQYGVVTRPIPRPNVPGGGSEASPTDIVVTEAFHPDPSSFARQQLGVLNVMGASSDEIEFDYHSKTGGKDFQVKVGKDVTFEGLPPKVATEALSSLLNTIPNKGRPDQPGFYLASIANREFIDREGKPIESKQQLSAQSSKKVPSIK